ncbi:hypothetical protein ENBRE01_0545 [Enteropsectra breve]|nr:hypothetical protein ENBRE01_0545 [Enteropsectra breve]
MILRSYFMLLTNVMMCSRLKNTKKKAKIVRKAINQRRAGSLNGFTKNHSNNGSNAKNKNPKEQALTPQDALKQEYDSPILYIRPNPFDYFGHLTSLGIQESKSRSNGMNPIIPNGLKTEKNSKSPEYKYRDSITMPSFYAGVEENKDSYLQKNGILCPSREQSKELVTTVQNVDNPKKSRVRNMLVSCMFVAGACSALALYILKFR